MLDNVEKAKQPLVKIYHYHCNHIGTPQELSDDKGDIVWLSYDRAWGGSFDTIYKQPFIDNFAISENELQPIKFQGQSLDTETGLHYNRFRYYDSDVGMFISRDPIELLGGFNVFAYAPNPVMWIDPWGLKHTYYQLKDANGKVVYHGITDRPVQERFIEHARDGKQFTQVSYIENLNSRAKVRNLEGSALYHEYFTDGNKSLLNAQRKATEGYYHSYDPDNIKEGRAFLTQSEIDNAMKNATHANVDKKGKISPCTGK